MAAQVCKPAAIIEPVGLLQLLKHPHKPLGCKAGFGHHTKAHPVSLALHIARIIQLALDCQRLATSDHGVGRLAVISAFACSQNSQNHRAHHPRRLGVLVGDISGNMALRYVAEFMG